MITYFPFCTLRNRPNDLPLGLRAPLQVLQVVRKLDAPFVACCGLFYGPAPSLHSILGRPELVTEHFAPLAQGQKTVSQLEFAAGARLASGKQVENIRRQYVAPNS